MKHKQGQRLFRRPFWTAERAGFPLRPESYGYFSIFFARVQVFLCKLAHFIQLWSKIQQPALIGQASAPMVHATLLLHAGTGLPLRCSPAIGAPGPPGLSSGTALPETQKPGACLPDPQLCRGWVQAPGPVIREIRQRSLHTTASLRAAGLTLKDHVVVVFILTHLIPDTVLLLTKHRHVDLSFPWERHFIISGNKNATAALLQTMAEKIRLNWKNKIFGGHPRSCWLLCTVCTHRLQSHLSPWVT